MPDIKLYGYATSPFVRKVGAFLYFKDLPFEHVPVNPTKPTEVLGFSDGTQVPVLAIGDEWKRDSTPIGLWLDEKFPDKPLLPSEPAARAKLLKIDGWINDMFFPSFFRGALDAPDTLAFRFTAWRLAAIVSAHTPLEEEIRHKWPDFLRMTPFIKAMVEPLDRSESLGEMQQRIGMELVGHFGEGPYFGSSPEPTLIDLTLFPQLVFPYMAGMTESIALAKVPAMKEWISRMGEQLPRNPTLIRDDLVLKWLDDGVY